MHQGGYSIKLQRRAEKLRDAWSEGRTGEVLEALDITERPHEALYLGLVAASSMVARGDFKHIAFLRVVEGLLDKAWIEDRSRRAELRRGRLRKRV